MKVVRAADEERVVTSVRQAGLDWWGMTDAAQEAAKTDGDATGEEECQIFIMTPTFLSKLWSKLG
jgi:hypothetical protein